jgi:hypothetical protein
MKKLVTLLVFMLAIASGCNGQDAERADGTAVQSSTDQERSSPDQSVPEPDSLTLRLFEETMAFARENSLDERPVGEIMVTLGERFSQSPYAAGMLDEPDTEKLICRLDAFDCVTFVEATLAMARTIKNHDYDYTTYANHIRDQRYRGGEMDGYCSRLHYFTEWIADNERRGNVENVTREVGGERYDKEISFMSEHRESYPRFAEDDSLYSCILNAEARLQDMELFYIPQERIVEAYAELEPGDIIATATHIKGLDVTHTGLVYDNSDGTRGLLHASTSGGVKVSPDLQSYVQGVDATIGIIVARPLEPAGS